MRLVWVVLFLGCGPPFVPVRVAMSEGYADSQWRYQLAVEVTHKLNASCVMNCEMGPTIEDGGCSDFQLFATPPASGRLQPAVCVQSGGPLFLPFDGNGSPAASQTSTARMIAPGAELEVSVLGPFDEPTCRSSFTVPAGGLTITAARDANGVCSFGR